MKLTWHQMLERRDMYENRADNYAFLANAAYDRHDMPARRRALALMRASERRANYWDARIHPSSE